MSIMIYDTSLARTSAESNDASRPQTHLTIQSSSRHCRESAVVAIEEHHVYNSIDPMRSNLQGDGLWISGDSPDYHHHANKASQRTSGLAGTHIRLSVCKRVRLIRSPHASNPTWDTGVGGFDAVVVMTESVRALPNGSLVGDLLALKAVFQSKTPRGLYDSVPDFASHPPSVDATRKKGSPGGGTCPGTCGHNAHDETPVREQPEGSRAWEKSLCAQTSSGFLARTPVLP